MQIMHLVQCGPTTGGTVSHVATQVVHQIYRGLNVAVVAASDGVLADRCREAGADVFIDSSLAPQGQSQSESSGSDPLIDLARQWRPDIIHAHLMHAGFRGHDVSSALGIPLIYTQHMYEPLDPFLHAAQASAWSVTVISVAQYAQQALTRFLGGGSCRVRYVPNGIDAPSRSTVTLASSAGPHVVFCGRLSPEKGADTAVLGFHQMLRSVPDATFHLIGTGPDETLLKRMVAAVGLSERTQFYGSVSGALAPGLGADIILAPSRGDAASLVLLEAMASQVPIVSTTVGGNSELIRHNIDGFLVAPDEPGSLAEAGLRILKRDDDRRRLTRSALERYRDLFQADAMVDRTIAIYREIRDH